MEPPNAAAAARAYGFCGRCGCTTLLVCSDDTEKSVGRGVSRKWKLDDEFDDDEDIVEPSGGLESPSKRIGGRPRSGGKA